MKKISIIIGIFSLFLFTRCDILEDVASEVVSTNGSGGTPAPSLTNREVIQGLKEALTVGIKNGASMASATDGFFKNSAILSHHTTI